MPSKQFLDTCGPMRQCIILLKYSIVFRKTKVHKRLQMVTKESFRGYLYILWLHWHVNLTRALWDHLQLHSAPLTTGIHILIGCAPYLNLTISSKLPFFLTSLTTPHNFSSLESVKLVKFTIHKKNVPGVVPLTGVL